MKKYKYGIILGITSMISSILFVGMPIGNNLLEIISIAIYIIGLLLILYFGIIKKKDKITIISAIIYIVILFTLIAIIELNYENFTSLAVGFVPGLIISIVGIIMTKNNNKEYKTKISLILNCIGLIISIISMLMAIINSGFILN